MVYAFKDPHRIPTESDGTFTPLRFAIAIAASLRNAARHLPTSFLFVSRFHFGQ